MSLGSMRMVLILALAAGVSTEVGAQSTFTVSDLADTDTANTLRNAVNLSNNVDAADSATITVAGTTTLGSSYEALNDALTLSIASGEFRIDQGAFNAFSDAGAGDPGSILKTGAGTLTVNGANTYVGGTTLSGGTLQILNGDALGTGALTFNTAATNVLLIGANLTLDENIVLNQAATLNVGTGFTGTLGGTITQDATARALTKTGAGVLVLNGATSYTGTTTVSAGTLRLGANERIANTSNVNLAAGTTLDLNNFSESIGSLTGAAGSFVSFNGAVTLTTTTSSNTTYAGTLTNSMAGSTLSKAGTGILTLTGDNGGYLGTLNVAGGTVDLRGALGGAVTIGAAGTLRSTGTRAIGGSVTNAGIIAPGGASLTAEGTFTVAGNYTQTGTYQADLLSTGTSDLIDVTGDAALAGTLALNGDINQQASYFGRSYTIIEADGTVDPGEMPPSGFAAVTDNFTLLNPTVTIDNTGATSFVRVSFDQFAVNLTDLAAPGNENQAGAATTVQNIITSRQASPEFLAAIDPLFNASLEESEFILEQLVGEINTASATAMVRSNSMFTGLALAQLQSGGFTGGNGGDGDRGDSVAAAPSMARFGMASTSSGFGMPGAGGLLSGQPQGAESEATDQSAVWVMGTGFWGDIDPTAVNQGFEYDGSGFVLGYTFGSTGDWRWGVQGGFAENEVDATRTIDKTEVDSWNIGLHGAYFEDGTYANTVLGYVSNEYDARRFFRFGATDLTGAAKFDGREFFAYGEIGHIFSQLDEEEVAQVSDLSTTQAFAEPHSKGLHKDHGRAEHKQVEPAGVEAEVVEEVETAFAEGWSVAPQLALQYRNFEQDGYTTTGAGALDQIVGGLDLDLFQTALGARFFYTGRLGDGGYIVPEVMVRWAHEFGDIDRGVTTAFALAPNQAFVVNGVRPDRDSLQVRTGVAAYTTRDWNVDVSYNGEFGDNFDNHAGVARATWFFD